jgi:hypothetical protein
MRATTAAALALAALSIPLGGQFRATVDVVEVTATVTDGGDTHSLLTMNEVRDALVASDVLVYALGFDRTRGTHDGADPQTLRQITDPTGGRTELVRPGQLAAAVDRITQELGRQYHLAYERAGPRDGRRHRGQGPWRPCALPLRLRG